MSYHTEGRTAVSRVSWNGERGKSGRERNQRDSLTVVMILGGWRAGRRAA